ncbi:MAG: glycogen debranching enzyme N-terminal domain-containing protein, partial [Armatimonadetes bacterium]|nr:glycogen debranching enzyme N-terminal domain-containing protein [Armatimonadota bacterium]
MARPSAGSLRCWVGAEKRLMGVRGEEVNESKDRFAIAVRWHGDEQEANEREWLETNGLGGYACGTLSGLRTRRYHGLLIAARNPPTGRTTLLTGVQEKLEVGGQRFCLSRVGRDEGYGFSPMVSVATFQRDPLTRWTFEGPWGQVSRVVLMPYLKNAVVLRYSVFSKEPIVLRVWIFVCERDHHWVTRGNGGFWARERNRTLIEVGAVGSDRPFLYLCHSADSFEWEGKWWEGVALPIERERGLEDWEDLFALGSFVKKVNGEGRLDLIAGIEPEDVWSAPVYELEERKRRNNLVRESSDPLLSALLLAADQFLALRSSQGRWTIVAGYPWFTDWGRDSLISLAGLTLVTGRFRIAREILTHFADRIRDGLVPNFFPEGGGEPAYNTVDASLWFIVALYRYFRYTKDEEFLRSVWAKVKEILESHLDGTWFGIKADGEDGLLS